MRAPFAQLQLIGEYCAKSCNGKMQLVRFNY